MASSPITAWQIEGGKVEVVTDFLFLGSKIIVDSDCSHEIKRHYPHQMRTKLNLSSFCFISKKCLHLSKHQKQKLNQQQLTKGEKKSKIFFLFL